MAWYIHKITRNSFQAPDGEEDRKTKLGRKEVDTWKFPNGYCLIQKIEGPDFVYDETPEDKKLRVEALNLQ